MVMSEPADRELIEHLTQALQAIEQHATDALGGGAKALDPGTALGLIRTVASEALKSG
jgi:hypothetical protein